MHIENVTVSPSGPTTKIAGEIFSLVCSADVYPLPVYGPLPIFEWFFDNSFLRSGVTVSNVTKSGNTTCASTLQFSPLRKIHAGIYTCQIGSKAVSTTISAVGKDSLLVLARSH